MSLFCLLFVFVLFFSFTKNNIKKKKKGKLNVLEMFQTIMEMGVCSISIWSPLVS